MDNPELYTAHTSEQTAGIESFFNKYGDFLKEKFGNEKVKLIDIGSGCGKILSNIIVPRSGLNFSQVVGVDVTKEMVDYSTNHFANKLQTFQLMDGEGEIPSNLREMNFDIVMSTYSLHWMKDIQKLLMNVRDLLKPGGYFCCVFLYDHLLIDIWEVLGQKFSNYMGKWKNDFCSFLWLENQVETMKEYLKNCGLRTVKFDDVETYANYVNAENFASEFKSILFKTCKNST